MVVRGPDGSGPPARKERRKHPRAG
jgi:hypothetical protein